MTTERTTSIPFLLRFAELIPPELPLRLGYDASAQVSVVQVEHAWVAALDQRCEVHRSTKKTGVGQETTDDD